MSVHQHDTIGIAFVAEDKYDPEVGSILPRLKGAHNVDDVRRIVYEEFTYWFGFSSGIEDGTRSLRSILGYRQQYPEARS